MELSELEYFLYGQEDSVSIISINRREMLNALNDKAVVEITNHRSNRWYKEGP
jgi:1,4-dihydroxy-2-naphthoyl-CoA synthase